MYRKVWENMVNPETSAQPLLASASMIKLVFEPEEGLKDGRKKAP